MGRGQVQGPQARTSGTYAMVPQAERADQPDIQGTFLLLNVFFKLGCIILIIVASCVIGLGLEVEASGKSRCMENSSLGPSVRVDQICQDCETEIFGILFMVR